jgi:hypothetical protein
MRYDAINLIAMGAAALNREGDGGAAYALYELANNLRSVMRDEASIADWNLIYVGADCEPLDIDKLLPVEA